MHVWIPDDGKGIILCSGQNEAALIEGREKFLPDRGFFLCLWTFPKMWYPFFLWFYMDWLYLFFFNTKYITILSSVLKNSGRLESQFIRGIFYEIPEDFFFYFEEIVMFVGKSYLSPTFFLILWELLHDCDLFI